MNNLHTPTGLQKRTLAQRLCRGLAIGLCVLLTVTALTVLLSYALTLMFDNAQQWHEWRSEHYWGLLAWRLTFYTAIGFVWLKLKARMSESVRLKNGKRLVKIEVLFILLILMAEFSKILFQTGGAA